MKKITLFLSALLLIGCGSQGIAPQFPGDNSIQKILVKQSSEITAKTGYPIALKEVKKLLNRPQLFEIDVWNEGDTEIIHFAFMQKNTNGTYKFIRIIIDARTNAVNHEILNNNGKIPVAVDLKYWKIDHTEILKIAQTNGLKDQTYLATLWEDTWHISGLKQDLYFQIDSQNGKIKMICTDPYLTNCLNADLRPTTLKLSPDFKKKRNKLKSGGF